MDYPITPDHRSNLVVIQTIASAGTQKSAWAPGSAEVASGQSYHGIQQSNLRYLQSHWRLHQNFYLTLVDLDNPPYSHVPTAETV
jgi:hypothetical protein